MTTNSDWILLPDGKWKSRYGAEGVQVIIAVGKKQDGKLRNEMVIRISPRIVGLLGWKDKSPMEFYFHRDDPEKLLLVPAEHHTSRIFHLRKNSGALRIGLSSVLSKIPDEDFNHQVQHEIIHGDQLMIIVRKPE